MIYSDCIPSLQEIKNETGWSGAGEVKQKILDQSKQLRRFGTKVEFHWVPGHKNVPGNVLADLVAKRAHQLTRGGFERSHMHLPLLGLRSDATYAPSKPILP